MKGDISKYTFEAKKHFHNVLMQQGRVLLDSDWNEQSAIAAYRVETGTNDIVGASGAPMHNGGFEIIQAIDTSSPPVPIDDLEISKGRFYVDGILCENEKDVVYKDQPDYCSKLLPTSKGKYLFYLDVWHRHLTAVECPRIREVALGGPDTTTRTKTIWQVKFAEIEATDNCTKSLSGIVNESTGKMKARSRKESGQEDPCGLKASGGYSRLENQLYRVEIHKKGTRSEATFKWSRDNGSIVVKWEGQDTVDTNKLTVSTEAKDDNLGFKAGDWIEIIDNKTDLLHKPGILAELSKVEGTIFTIKAGSEIFPDGFTSIDFDDWKNNTPRIRRWDSIGELKLNSSNTKWVDLEDGVEVQFIAANYNTGDYWQIPARTAKADIEWPYSDPQSPQGVLHHYAKLGIAELDNNGNWDVIADCRPQFPPVTELISFFYLGGDGQEARPGKPLLAPLMVGVSNGKWPLKDIKVDFTKVNSNGTITPLNNSKTDADGIARCNWKLGPSGKQMVVATIKDGNNKTIHLPIFFNASINLASNIEYDGNGCPNWGGQKPDTVAKAITELCNKINTQPEPESKFKIKLIYWANEGKDEFLFDQLVDLQSLRNGFFIVCNMDVDPNCIFMDKEFKQSRAIGQLSIEIPFSYQSENPECFGFLNSPLIVPFHYSLDDQNIIKCIPKSANCLDAYMQLLNKMIIELNDSIDRLLVRFTLNGNLIWAKEDSKHLLDADLFAMKMNADNCLVPIYESGDGKKGGTLDLRFYLSCGKMDGGGSTMPEKIKYPFSFVGEVSSSSDNINSYLINLKDPKIALVGGSQNLLSNDYLFKTNLYKVKSDGTFQIKVNKPLSNNIITENEPAHFRIQHGKVRSKEYIDLTNHKHTLRELFDKHQIGREIIKINIKREDIS